MGRCDGRQLLRLLHDRGDHLRMLMSEVGEHQLTGEVQVVVAVVVPHRAAGSAGQRNRLGSALCGPGMKHARGIEAGDLGVGKVAAGPG
jgi:hypothetical protein